MGAHDALICSTDSNIHPITVRRLYSALPTISPSNISPYPLTLWKANCPLKSILFGWLLYHNRNLVWDVLQSKGWQGPSQCVFCHLALETNIHIFLHCPFTSSIWLELSNCYGFTAPPFSSVSDAFLWWSSQRPLWQAIFLLSVWHVWKSRCACVFRDLHPHIQSISSMICSFLPPD